VSRKPTVTGWMEVPRSQVKRGDLLAGDLLANRGRVTKVEEPPGATSDFHDVTIYCGAKFRTTGWAISRIVVGRKREAVPQTTTDLDPRCQRDFARTQISVALTLLLNDDLDGCRKELEKALRRLPTAVMA
jgi:hypothetical protein